ncbi:hypothetical protein D9753_18645 [Streptomyces dangxiongensis]|uniref:Lipoprotein n=1 Tax=Streptomyces dangxiongensis TaxID=1442032 RepID=A0A3G2JQZ2_9ACTN|nr:hypothetical protein [Streptomyces dangxiongensis]AYN43739.1 hypothetical protein D9753_18645 [Streptomyces dangxiongensis]
MRPLNVPVRLAVAVLAVTAAAGCVNVGDDAGRARPAHSTGRHRGGAPGGGPVAGAGGVGREEPAVGGKHGRGGKAKPGGSHPATAGPSGADSASAAPAKPGSTAEPGEPAPSKVPPTPPVTSAPAEPPASTPPAPVSEPPSAEPSSSAHEETGPQLVQREPAPAAGVAA